MIPLDITKPLSKASLSWDYISMHHHPWPPPVTTTKPTASSSSDDHQTIPIPQPPSCLPRFPSKSTHGLRSSAATASEVAESGSDALFHVAEAPFVADENFGSPAEPAKLSSDERRDHDELSDGGTTPTSYAYKKRKSSRMAATVVSEYRKDREEWSDTAIASLLDAYAEKYTSLNRGNLRGRDWGKVAAIVSERCRKQTKSVEQCKNKVDNLKKRFKSERRRMSNGGVAASHWPWYKKLEEIFSEMLPAKSATNDKTGVEEEWRHRRGRVRGLFLVLLLVLIPVPIYFPRTTVAPCTTGPLTCLKSKAGRNPRWQRLVFKISGSALAGSGQNNIDPKVAIVVEGRNFFCGNTWVTATGLDRCTVYEIGMMATVMNSVLVQSALEKMGIQTRVQSTFPMHEVTEPYSRRRAIRHLEKGRVVIFGGIGAGTGNSLFSTDTAATLRASEIHADALLKGTDIDSVYSCDSPDDNLTFEHTTIRE